MADKVARVAFVADVQNFVNGVDKAQGSVKGFQDGVGKMALPAALAFGAVTAAAIDFTKAAAEDQKAADILAQQLRNTTGATNDQIASTEAWITQTSMAAAVADDQLRPALGQLATATGSVAEAQNLMGTALNISAQTGKPLEAVTKALAKAYDGNYTALNRLAPGLVDTSQAGLTFAGVLDQLNEKTQGAAEAAANADPYTKMGIAIQETKEAIGAGLLPILQQFVPYLISAASWAQQNSQLLLTLGGVIAGVAGAILAINAALKVYEAVTAAVKLATTLWTVAQTALNLVLSLNPIGIVVLAIGALVAAIVLAYNNSETFRNIVNAVFNSFRTTVVTAFNVVKTTIGAVWDWLATYVVPFVSTQIQANIAAFNLLKDVVVSVFGTIRNAVETAWSFVSGVIENIVGGIRRALDTIRTLPGVGNIISGFRAAGGPVLGGRAYIVGEAGPELFVPQTSGTIIPNGGLAGGGGVVNITVNGALDPVGVAQQIRRILAQQDARLGLA